MKTLSRRAARERILRWLFQRDFRPVSNDELAHEDPYVREVAAGVSAKQPEIDRLIAQRAEGWRLERLHTVDRNILRLAIYELLYREDIPPEVVINEAVELAKKYGGEHSPAFVNGILDRIWKEVRKKESA
ncbi:MAG: transcription antitermination factor NusB [Candidatus Bipolaricaulota bacterium]|nr:transcription antitermination factor NusB [Candidatus Bipolaricaulota bacterium]MDW8110018.1 transcription antitermination factor NusB [Candidatus Bipolaricaulota bacterium]MDW8328910.1 transcription antitermination factor NusB [Candidatus Bipolaricaulota bacterium]